MIIKYKWKKGTNFIHEYNYFLLIFFNTRNIMYWGLAG